MTAASVGAATTAAALVAPAPPPAAPPVPSVSAERISAAGLAFTTQIDPVATLATGSNGAPLGAGQESASEAAREQVVARMLVERAEQQQRASRLAARAAASTVRAKAVAQAKALAAAPLIVARSDPKSIARALMGQSYGWGPREFACLEQMWTRESQWKATAHNPSSGAHGIPQALPGSKMSSAGKDWQTNPATQIRWGLSYVKSRYRTPCGAWAFWQSHHWY